MTGVARARASPFSSATALYRMNPAYWKCLIGDGRPNPWGPPVLGLLED